MNAAHPIDRGSRPAAPAPLMAVWLVCRTVWLGALRRKDLGVAALLMGLYVVGAGAVGIVRESTTAESRFIMNLGLTVSYWLSAVVTAFLAAREIPEEIENRTLYPLLAKPVSRGQFVTGKFVAVAVVGAAVLLVFTQFTLWVSPWLPEFQAGTMAQALALAVFSLAMLSALVICASVWLPAAAALVLGLASFFFLGVAIEAIRTGFDGVFRTAIAGALWYVPDFSRLDLLARFTDGAPPLAGGDYGRLVLHTAVLTALLIYAAAGGLRRKAL